MSYLPNILNNIITAGAARSALGLGTAAQSNTGDFDAAGSAAAANYLPLAGGTMTGNLVLSSPIRLKEYLVGALPAGTKGDTAFVTDALLPAFLAAVAGGGAITAPVFHNGTTWIVQ